MSHHQYTTPGFVIDSKQRGEAGKLLYLFTRELGLVIAVAQGVRLGVSKLRYHTQDFSQGIFSLVRGKEVWRLTGATAAEKKGSVDEGTTDGVTDGVTKDFTPSELQILFVRVCSLLRRLLHGEEANEALFDALAALQHFISQKEVTEYLAKNSDGTFTELVECIIVLRILFTLGYVENTAGFEQFLNDTKHWSLNLVEHMKPLRKDAVSVINKGLQASQL